MTLFSKVMMESKANFLTLIRQDSKTLSKLVMDERPNNSQAQIQFQTKMLDNKLILDFLPNNKVIINRYRDDALMEYLHVWNIQDAYKQVRYFSNSGRLKGAEAVMAQNNQKLVAENKRI